MKDINDENIATVTNEMPICEQMENNRVTEIILSLLFVLLSLLILKMIVLTKLFLLI